MWDLSPLLNSHTILDLVTNDDHLDKDWDIRVFSIIIIVEIKALQPGKTGQDPGQLVNNFLFLHDIIVLSYTDQVLFTECKNINPFLRYFILYRTHSRFMVFLNRFPLVTAVVKHSFVRKFVLVSFHVTPRLKWFWYTMLGLKSTSSQRYGVRQMEHLWARQKLVFGNF